MTEYDISQLIHKCVKEKRGARGVKYTRVQYASGRETTNEQPDPLKQPANRARNRVAPVE